MYLHIGNNVMLPEKHIIGVFDLEITSQSKRTSEFLRQAEEESLVIDACRGHSEVLPRVRPPLSPAARLLVRAFERDAAKKNGRAAVTAADIAHVP